MPVKDHRCVCWGPLHQAVPEDHATYAASLNETPIEYGCDTCSGISWYRKGCTCEACVLFTCTRSNLEDSRDDWDPIAEFNTAMALVQEELDEYKKKVEKMEMALIQQDQVAQPTRQQHAPIPEPVLYWDRLTKNGPFIQVCTGLPGDADKTGQLRVSYYGGRVAMSNGLGNQIVTLLWPETLTTADPNAPEPVAAPTPTADVAPVSIPLIFALFCLSAFLSLSVFVTALFVHLTQ